MHGSETTTELEPVPEHPRPSSPVRPRGRWWCGLTGSLAAGLVVLALAVLVAQVLGWSGSSAGPGAFATVGHIVVAALAVAAQRVADRGRGRPAALAAAAVVVLTGAALWLFWWA